MCFDLGSGFIAHTRGAATQNETERTTSQFKRFPQLQIQVTLIGGREQLGTIDEKLQGWNLASAFLCRLLRCVKHLESPSPHQRRRIFFHRTTDDAIEWPGLETKAAILRNHAHRLQQSLDPFTRSRAEKKNRGIRKKKQVALRTCS